MYNSINRVECIPGLWIGDYDAACDKELLESYAITHIVSLYRTPVHPNDFEYMCINIDDNEREKIYKYFSETNKFIENGLKDGYGVLVHCAGGVSRSATIVIAYMMSTMNIDVKNALSILKQYRLCVSPNRGFLSQLEQYCEAKCYATKVS